MLDIEIRPIALNEEAFMSDKVNGNVSTATYIKILNGSNIYNLINVIPNG